MNPAMNASAAASGALRRRSRRRSASSGTARLRQAAAGADAQANAGPDDLVEAITQRVIKILRPEMRSLELRLTRTVAEVALKHLAKERI